jgi:hypothetical protein
LRSIVVPLRWQPTMKIGAALCVSFVTGWLLSGERDAFPS